MRLAVTLEGPAAEQILRSIAMNYALLSIHAQMTDARGTVNAPWLTIASSRDVLKVHRDWLKRVDREKASYRKALLSLFAELPEPPTIDWPDYDFPDGRKARSLYEADRAYAAARAYAGDIVARAKKL